ncbi:hypothetical protein FUAX_34020 [Fulvitalea axinellae]|uniref:Outer membrane protein beta-barrel domain-containing protein n=1 Tax=Fulvitalea axinellae TaxID=1182444 RepID=A0AAU9CNI0_9BACT|nr:hypothetical protein FUAX_34020 [Fulvitalea axinellae]
MRIPQIRIIRIFALSLLFSASALITKAQAQEEAHYSTEFVWGLTKATNSGLLGGFVFRYSQLVKGRQFQTFAAELVNIKHPNETREQLPQTGNSILVGKSNYLYDLRLQYGRDFIVFKKAQHKGVQINAIFAGGPSIGIVTPYYVDYNGQNGREKVPYTGNNMNFNNILGPGNLFQGVPDASIAPGLNAKAGLAFEFGAKNDLFVVETGVMYEYFFKEIEILLYQKKYQSYPNAYITISYGSRR